MANYSNRSQTWFFKKKNKLFTTIVSLAFVITFSTFFLQNAIAQKNTDDDFERTSLLKTFQRERLSTNNRFIEIDRLLAEDEERINDFGFDVDISGDTAVVGAYIDNSGANAGSAYVYVRNGQEWVQQQEIFPMEGQPGQFFGRTVAISGDTIAIGAMLDGQKGSAYIFVREGTIWTLQQKIPAPSNTSTHPSFGESIEIEGDTILIGAAQDAVDGDIQRGSVFVYVRDGTTWTQEAKFFSDDGGPADRFGYDIALEGDTAVIGAVLTNIGRGSAYIFNRNGTNWEQKQKLIPSNGADNDNFGNKVSLSGNLLAIGSPRHNGGLGAAYIYTKTEGVWIEEQKIVENEKDASGNFGFSVAILGDICLIGSPGTYTGKGNGSGVVYSFVRNNSIWNQQQKLFNETDPLRDTIGYSVAISRNTAVIGAVGGASTGDNERGSAYVFSSNSTITPFDFDGDSKTDVSIFRPSLGEWWYLRSSDLGNRALQFGSSTDIPTPADFTGDGKTDISFFRNGEWFVLRSEDDSFFSFPWGQAGDIPAPGDFDGDGSADPTVFRPNDSTWFILKSTGGVDFVPFGIPEDKPVIADYDRDGKDDIAVYRPSVSEWWINQSTDGSTALQFGQAGDQTVQGDYTGDGKADVAFFRPTTGEWFIIRSEDFSFFSFPFGTTNDIPAPGDYDGDGTFDAAVFRPSNTTWFINGTQNGVQIVGFGLNGDVPVPSVYSVE